MFFPTLQEMELFEGFLQKKMERARDQVYSSVVVSLPSNVGDLEVAEQIDSERI